MGDMRGWYCDACIGVPSHLNASPHLPPSNPLQSGFVMRDVESQAKRHPREMVARALDRDFQFEVVALS